MSDLVTIFIVAVRGRDCWLAVNREDSPQERERLAEKLRSKMKEDGIVSLPGDNIEFETEDRSLQILRAFRERLIEDFRQRQLVACEYLSFTDVARFWAPLRRESNLKDQKAGALADLMEAAFDGDLQDVLFLHPKTGVEFEIGGAIWRDQPKHPLYSLSKRDEDTARFELGQLSRSIGVLSPVEFEAYCLAEMAPHCWCRRESVVALLLRCGVDRAALPPQWLGIPRAKRGPKPKYNWDEARQFFDELMAEMGDLDKRPEWSRQADIECRLLEKMAHSWGCEPAVSLIQQHLSRWLSDRARAL